MFWMTLVTIVKKIPWQVWLLSGLLIVFFLTYWYAYGVGKAKVQLEWNESVQRGNAILAELKPQQEAISTKIETVYIDRVETVYEKQAAIIKEIPIYISADSCDLPGGFRLLHDAAASGTLPSTSGLDNAAPVPAQVAAATITDNYTTCHEISLRLIALQDFYREQSALRQRLQK